MRTSTPTLLHTAVKCNAAKPSIFHRTHRMRGKDEGGHQGHATRHQLATHFKVQNRHEAMQNDVDQMISQRVGFSKPIVPSEGEDGERPVTLVTLLLAHWRSPKVIGKQVLQWDVRSEIAIIHDCCDVVKDEVAGQRIPIDDRANQKEARVHQPPSPVEDR